MAVFEVLGPVFKQKSKANARLSLCVATLWVFSKVPLLSLLLHTANFKNVQIFLVFFLRKLLMVHEDL